MPRLTMTQATRALRRASYLSLLAAALALSACAASGTAPEATGQPDEALQGHSQWCGMNPPSGYCDVDDNR